MYFFTENDYPTTIGNYLRESLYPTATFLSIVMFIASLGQEFITELFSLNFFNIYFLSIIFIYPILSTILIAPVKLIDWCGFRYYNSKRNAIFQVGQKVGTLFNSITGMTVIASIFLSIFSVGLIICIRVAISILFYIFPLNILSIIILKYYILPRKGLSFKQKIIIDKKYKIITENTIIKFEKVD